ncbi:hypothetical protein EH223_03820 [candidate division KSB1 bacterium]|nr:hypothetical protein [candidate division KSB1 bacterium]RQW05725.1 MAG: hypothetical protein EH223_03820 [candidate division KSB1 bacterium]
MPIRSIPFLLLFIASQLMTQTIRPHHWIEHDVRYYWHRGLLWDLSPLERPFMVQELTMALDSVAAVHNEPGVQLLNLLPSSDESERALGWVLLDNALRDDRSVKGWHAVQRATIGAQIHPKLQVYGTFYVDNQLDADTSYIGKRQSGVAAFMEQAYLLFHHKGWRLRFGRDYLVWGPGLDASLHLSSASRPIDHLFLSWQNRWLKFSFFTGSLDKTEYLVEDEPSEQNRYLSGHRLEVRPMQHLRIALSETALFGGPNAGNDFALMNPLLFYTGIQFNGPQTANVMASLDVVYMPAKNVTLYSSYLLDDIQFEKEAQDDQEPGEFGVLAGLNWSDPFLLRGMDIFAEYTRITNRTYNGQGGMWEKYLHRNIPIGHMLGNDFDRLVAGIRYRPYSAVRFALQYEHRRCGEGRISDVFTTPWRDIPAGQIYTEPFPTGVVEQGDNYRCAARWHPLLWLYGDIGISYWHVKNAENVSGAMDKFWELSLNLSVELLRTWSIR